MTDAREITRALGGRWHGGYGVARCPAHEDRTPSLSLKDGREGRLLARCHAGCEWTAVADALRSQGLLPAWRGDARGADPRVAAEHEREERAAAEKRARQARWCWKGARPIEGTPAERYLRGRGITGLADLAGFLPRSLRFHPACWHAPTARRRPALVALVEGAAGAFAVHRTYLTAQGRKLEPAEDAKLSLGATLGGAVRLREGRRGRGGKPSPLVVAEGIETALAVGLGAAGRIDPAARLWAALSAPGLAGLVLPSAPGRLVVAADGDAAGRQAAEALAERARAAGVARDAGPRARGAGLERRADGEDRSLRTVFTPRGRWVAIGMGPSRSARTSACVPSARPGPVGEREVREGARERRRLLGVAEAERHVAPHAVDLALLGTELVAHPGVDVVEPPPEPLAGDEDAQAHGEAPLGQPRPRRRTPAHRGGPS